MSATKQFSLDLHRLADDIDASDDPGDLRKQAVDLSILHDKLAAAQSRPTSPKARRSSLVTAAVS